MIAIRTISKRPADLGHAKGVTDLKPNQRGVREGRREKGGG